MRRSQFVPMTTDEVKERATRVLTPIMKQFGMSDVEVREERDFDGSDVYRVVIAVAERVPPRVLIDGSDELQQLLRSEGEDRWLYLSTRRDSVSYPDEDVE